MFMEKHSHISILFTVLMMEQEYGLMFIQNYPSIFLFMIQHIFFLEQTPHYFQDFPKNTMFVCNLHVLVNKSNTYFEGNKTLHQRYLLHQHNRTPAFKQARKAMSGTNVNTQIRKLVYHKVQYHRFEILK